jgi:hypothetical protein
VSVNNSKNWCTLLLEYFETGNFLLVCGQKRIRVDVREGRRKLQHLLLGKVQAVPKLLQFESGVLHEQVKVLMFELIQA